MFNLKDCRSLKSIPNTIQIQLNVLLSIAGFLYLSFFLLISDIVCGQIEKWEDWLFCSLDERRASVAVANMSENYEHD